MFDSFSASNVMLFLLIYIFFSVGVSSKMSETT